MIPKTFFYKNNNIDEIDINEIDETRSKMIHITLPPDNEFNKIRTLNAVYEGVKEDATVGRIRVDWEITDMSNITQFNVNWFSTQESVSHRKTSDSTNSSCLIPVMRTKYGFLWFAGSFGFA